MGRKTIIGFGIAVSLAMLGGCVRQPIKAKVPVSRGIVSFQAVPRTIQLGERATLRWQTVGAEEIFIDQDPPPLNIFSQPIASVIENLPPEGQLNVRPQVTTTYILGCKATAWTSYASARVKVKDPKGIR